MRHSFLLPLLIASLPAQAASLRVGKSTPVLFEAAVAKAEHIEAVADMTDVQADTAWILSHAEFVDMVVGLCYFQVYPDANGGASCSDIDDALCLVVDLPSAGVTSSFVLDGVCADGDELDGSVSEAVLYVEAWDPDAGHKQWMLSNFELKVTAGDATATASVFDGFITDIDLH